MRRPYVYVPIAIWLAVLAAWAQQAQKQIPKYKAIWEPVNYPQDAELGDVFFVSAEVGWVVGMAGSDAGDGGIILHTADGGQHWDVQLGNPHSATRCFFNLFFLDARHGWATQAGGGHLVRTTDGETWEEISKFQADEPYTFATPDVGFDVHGDEIYRTADGGRNWKLVFTCHDKVEVDGLMRDVGCRFHSISCPTAQACYAASGALPNNNAAIAATEDGGLTWNISRYVPNAGGGDYGLLFTDAKTGFMRGFAEIWSTLDGAQTWRKLPGTFPGGSTPRIRFADREVGWLANGRDLAYTSDGGKHWNAIEVRLPAGINSSSLPARDRGYVVGNHGMVYRYRVVPVEYTAKGMIAAPVIAAK
ncbi:MAG TPA: YCF48-related protein [Bryobacteraceae bacterium]|nr:YCF48-related protein [Bryobacteraceae bacterium]